ncbi:hypothetical protein BJF78_03315 [Pseudonocardia sp. CNS-139]|nr:hypothetical protein BJF78_03315 [Pseudonocardia sp. CNS-139]
MRSAAALVLVVLAGVAGLTGCTVRVAGTAQAAPAVARQSAGDAYTDANGRFALVPPPGWAVDASGAQGTSVVFVDPQPGRSAAGALRANINVFVATAVADLPGTVVGARNELRAIADYAPTADEPAALADGTPAHLLGGTFTDPGSGLPLRNVQLVTVHAGLTIVATGTSLQDAWAGAEPAIRTSLGSLTVSI